jgi:hypothetical protein
MYFWYPAAAEVEVVAPAQATPLHQVNLAAAEALEALDFFLQTPLLNWHLIKMLVMLVAILILFLLRSVAAGEIVVSINL